MCVVVGCLSAAWPPVFASHPPAVHTNITSEQGYRWWCNSGEVWIFQPRRWFATVNVDTIACEAEMTARHSVSSTAVVQNVSVTINEISFIFPILESPNDLWIEKITRSCTLSIVIISSLSIQRRFGWRFVTVITISWLCIDKTHHTDPSHCQFRPSICWSIVKNHCRNDYWFQRLVKNCRLMVRLYTSLCSWHILWQQSLHQSPDFVPLWYQR